MMVMMMMMMMMMMMRRRRRRRRRREEEEEEQFYAESVDERVSDDDDNDNEASGPPIVLQWQGTALLPAIGDHIYSKHFFNVINLFNLSPTKCQLCACVFTCMSAHAKRMRVCVCFV